jgi:mRNA interferase RelE/StbE
MIEIQFYESAWKDLKKLDKAYQQQIINTLNKFSSNPNYMDIKKLKGRENEYRIINGDYRIGDYRIIFEWENGKVKILIITFGHKKEIYK